MKITYRTLIKDLLPFIDKESFEIILEKVDPQPLECSLLNMSIAEYSELIEDTERYIETNILHNETTVWLGFGRLKQLRIELDELDKWLKKFKVPTSKDEKQAAIGIEFPDNTANMLITVTEFFHLKSFAEAEQVKLCDYLLIYQHQQTQQLFQHNYNRLKEMQAKTKYGKQNR